MQALTSGLARSGGIGAAKIIAEALLKHSLPGNQAGRKSVTADTAPLHAAI